MYRKQKCKYSKLEEDGGGRDAGVKVKKSTIMWTGSVYFGD